MSFFNSRIPHFCPDLGDRKSVLIVLLVSFICTVDTFETRSGLRGGGGGGGLGVIGGRFFFRDLNPSPTKKSPFNDINFFQLNFVSRNAEMGKAEIFENVHTADSVFKPKLFKIALSPNFARSFPCPHPNICPVVPYHPHQMVENNKIE